MSVRMACPAAFTPARMRNPTSRPGPRNPVRLVRLALSKDALKTNGPATARIASAIRWTCSSLSMTHGPPMSAMGWPAPKQIVSPRGVLRLITKSNYRTPESIAPRVLADIFDNAVLRGEPAAAVLVGRTDESAEQRVRLERLGLELGVEL